MFEAQVECRLFLRALCERVIPLKTLGASIHQYVSATEKLRPASGQLGTKSLNTLLGAVVWGMATGDQATLVRCKVPSKVDTSVLRAISACLQGPHGHATVIRTADNAPFCDFVVLNKTAVGATVIFVEATISSLLRHSTQKTVDNSTVPASTGQAQKNTRGASAFSMASKAKRRRSMSSADAGARAADVSEDLSFADCPASLRDILSLAARPMYKVTRNKGSAAHFSKVPPTEPGAESVANAWLKVMDAPCRLAAHMDIADRTTRYHVTKEALPDRIADSAQWQVGILYVSGSHLREQSQAGLSQLECDFAYCATAQHLEVAAAQPISRPSSPSKHNFCD